MTDIVERLRSLAESGGMPLRLEAAAELERLRAEQTEAIEIAQRELAAAEKLRAQLEASVSQQCWGPGQFAVVATFRYCLGRQTYIVQECADWLLLHWPVIEQPVRNLIRRELEQAFEQDDKARAGEARSYKPLGLDCDSEQWARVRSLWANAC